jgi:hypothetical protein
VPKRGLIAENPDYDFGMLAPEEAARAEHVFLVRNTANRPLRITDFRSSCACTVASLPTGPIAPDESARVTVRADWSNAAGAPYARVTLKTDNFWTPSVALLIHAELRPATSDAATSQPEAPTK